MWILCRTAVDGKSDGSRDLLLWTKFAEIHLFPGLTLDRFSCFCYCMYCFKTILNELKFWHGPNSEISKTEPL
jgi:hypothetical protein